MADLVLFLLVWALYNVYVFFVVMRYKRREQRERVQTPEFNLLLMGIVLGGIGLFAGIQYFKHKNTKPKFMIGAPLLIVWNVIAMVFLYNSGHLTG